MVEELKMMDMVLNNRDRINNYIEEKNISKNPYDIQQFCIEQTTVFPERFIQEDELNTIKLYAYGEGLPLIAYMRVLAILVRDQYFIDHNININDIDKHDPGSCKM